MITQAEAQQLHDVRQMAEPDHDDIGCWCCCLTCDFDTKFISDFFPQEEEIDAATVARIKESEEAIARGDVVDERELRELMAKWREGYGSTEA